MWVYPYCLTRWRLWAQERQRNFRKRGAFWNRKGTAMVESCLRALCLQINHIYPKRESGNPASGEPCMLVSHTKVCRLDPKCPFFYFTTRTKNNDSFEAWFVSWAQLCSAQLTLGIIVERERPSQPSSLLRGFLAPTPALSRCWVNPPSLKDENHPSSSSPSRRAHLVGQAGLTGSYHRLPRL